MPARRPRSFPSARPRSHLTSAGVGRGGFEGVVDPATRRALLDLTRTMATVEGVPGPAGPAGATGPQGPQGIPGPAGALGKVAYAQIVAAQAGITTFADIAGLSVTWTATAGRMYRISAHGEVASTVTGDVPVMLILDAGNVGFTRSTPGPLAGVGYSHSLEAVVIQTGLSGTQTRKIRAQRAVGTGSITFYADPAFPAFILVEDIGAA